MLWEAQWWLRHLIYEGKRSSVELDISFSQKQIQKKKKNAKQTRKNLDKNHVSFFSSSLCLWLMQNMLKQNTAKRNILLASVHVSTLFGDIV